MTTRRAEIPPVADPETPPETRGIVLDRAAAVYDILLPLVELGQTARTNRRTAAFLEIAPSDRVLDVGCATGGVALEVARHLDASLGGIAVGLDASPRMIARARRKVRNLACRFDVGVAESLPYPDATFDRAVSTFFFHHLNLADKLRALREVMRVLRPGARFVVVDVDVPTNWFGRLCARSGEWLFKQPEIGENIDGKLPPLFTEAGFANVSRLRHDMGYVTTFAMTRP